MTRVQAACVLSLLTLLVAGCGERPQVVKYQQGSYSGKPDTPAYQGAPFDGDKVKWEHALQARAQNQNEYKRIK